MKHSIPRTKRHRVFMAVLLMIVATPPLVQAETDCTEVTEIPQVECEALVALYNSTDGQNWSDSSTNNWNVTNTPCSWSGVYCYAGQVTGIDKLGNQLTGTIPPELGNLSNLTHLGLGDNQLTGTIPPELGNLSHLTHLNLAVNQLTGTIPSALENLSNLTVLYLSSNQLTGVIPSELGNLSNLTELYLNINQLTGIILPLGNMSNLIRFNLNKNQFTGTIPPELGNLSHLIELQINKNQLTGTIPPELGSLSNLTQLKLHTNQLTGAIPPELGNLSKLTELKLHTNQLTGAIPSELGNLSNLTYLELHTNQLTGIIPQELGNLSNLTVLYLYTNQLTGTIPPELGNLNNLTELYLNANQLTGTIPPELGNMSNLTVLQLNTNQLTGTIPHELGNLSNLIVLRLRDNQLTGIIPSELGNLSNLTGISLQYNQLTGTIPPELGSLSNLTQLKLNNNQLTGTILQELGSLSHLTDLLLSENQLIGTIPPELENLSSLSEIDLACNLLTIPSDQSLIDFIDARPYSDSQNDDWKNTQDGSCSSSTLSTPLSPTDLNATVVSQTQINLSWTDNSSDETGFKVERDGSLIQTVAANVINYNDTDLICGTTYNYSVTATNAIGDSTAIIVSATTTDCTPTAPTDINATVVSQTQINLSWTDNSSDETGFKVERPAGTLISTAAADAISYSDTDLICGTTYNYSVTATNAIADSTAITTSATTTACFVPTAPTAPTALNATIASQTQINLSWIDNSSDEIGFKVERDGVLITTAAADAANYSDSGLSCGTTYSYSVKATNATGDSTAVTASATTRVCSTRVSLSDITLICNDCTIENAAPKTVAEQPVSPGDYVFPQGLVYFELTDIVNSQAHITIYYNNINYLDDFIYRKYGPTPDDPNSANWYNFPNVTIELDTLDSQTMLKVNLTLTDGEWGDDTGLDGRIVDPGGIARAITSSSSTVSSSTVGCQTQSSSFSGSCNVGKHTLTNEVEVGKNASVSNAFFENDVDNKGMISNSTIGTYATLTGGKLSGYIINEGTLADVNFVGMEISGGILSGYIVNNSKVGGVIRDVQLAGGTTITGGKVGGEINGVPENPALITNAKIMSGCQLTHVCLSPTVKLPKNVELGEGIRLPKEPLTPADFCLVPEEIASLNAKTLSHLELAIFAVFSAEDFAKIPPEAFRAMTPRQIAAIQKETLEGMTTEQFEQLPVDTLGGLTSENMGGLPTAVINELTSKHLDALNEEAFKAMSSREVSKLFVNLDAEKITPEEAEKLVPGTWKLDLETGALTAPVGAELTFQNLRFASPSEKVTLPKIPHLDKGLGIDGSGSPLIEETQHALATEENMANFFLSQDNKGILLVEGTGDSEGVQYAFIPDADNAIQVDTDKMPIGLSVSAGGFFTITTPEGLQYRVIPAPKDPVALSQVLGGSEIVIGKRGDVMVEIPTATRRGGARQVLIFDPFIEPAPEDICVELDTGETFCEFDNAPEHIKRPGLHLPTGNKQTRAGEKAKMVYPDGTAQTVLPTVLSPDIFIQEAIKFKGMKGILFNADGTFYTFYQGNSLLVRTNFDVKTETIEEDKTIAPSITRNDKGLLTYSIPTNEPTQTRRGGARQILIFDLFIEPAPEELCVELDTGETFCEFDNAAEHVQPIAAT
jgi:Leucine-rich repeat (LRR) protein